MGKGAKAQVYLYAGGDRRWVDEIFAGGENGGWKKIT